MTNAQAQIIKEGGISDVLKAVQDLSAKQEQCCNEILRRLDRLDDILAAVKNLQGENEKLRAQLDTLSTQYNTLREQVTGLPKPLTAQETTNIAAPRLPAPPPMHSIRRSSATASFLFSA